MVTAIDIYKAYPRKVGRKAAIKAIEKALKESGDSAEEILDRTEKYAMVVKDRDVNIQYVKHPSTFFNQYCWQDDFDHVHPAKVLSTWEKKQKEEALRAEASRIIDSERQTDFNDPDRKVVWSTGSMKRLEEINSLLQDLF